MEIKFLSAENLARYIKNLPLIPTEGYLESILECYYNRYILRKGVMSFTSLQEYIPVNIATTYYYMYTYYLFNDLLKDLRNMDPNYAQNANGIGDFYLHLEHHKEIKIFFETLGFIYSIEYKVIKPVEPIKSFESYKDSYYQYIVTISNPFI